MNKSLITITTCNRLPEVKKYIWDYIDFCNRNEGFDFLLALDGNNEDYINFCAIYEIPLLYSEAREGVGLSKNRVLKQFPDYDYYFFIEDDIELLNSSIFSKYIKGSESAGLEHLNHFGIDSEAHITKVIIQFSQGTIISKMTGGGYFNFFTKKGIETVGGFHSEFAKYKRYGHTEHSIRFVNAGLQKYPFNGIIEASKDLLIHTPPHVTPVHQTKFTQGISEYEQKITDQKLTYYPIKTMAAWHFNGYDMSVNETADIFLSTHKKRYPLTKGKERRAAFSELYFFRFRSSKGIKAFWFFILANLCFPLHPNIKHYIKTKLRRHAK